MSEQEDFAAAFGADENTLTEAVEPQAEAPVEEFETVEDAPVDGVPLTEAAAEETAAEGAPVEVVDETPVPV